VNASLEKKTSRRRKRRRRWSRLAPVDLMLMVAVVGGATLFVAAIIFIGFSQWGV